MTDILNQLASELNLDVQTLRSLILAGDESLQPSYLTTDSQGKVNAQFTGKVKAQGLDLEANLHPLFPNDIDSIRWLYNNDTQLAARLSGYRDTDVGSPIPDGFKLSAGSSESTWVGGAEDDTGFGGISAQAHVATGGAFNKLVINGNGDSGFLQWDAIASPQPKVRRGVLSFSFGALPAGTETSVNFSVPWTSTLELIGAFANTGGGVNSSGTQLCSWCYFPFTTGAVQLVVRNNSAFGMAIGGVWQGFAFYT